MVNGHIQDRARDALNSIPNDLAYPGWNTAGIAAIAAGLTIEDIDAWSAGAANYKGTKAVASIFRNVTPDGGTQAGTLFGMARDHGWQDGSTTPRLAPARTTKPVEPPKAPRLGMSASEVYHRCEAATNLHGYIVAKRAASLPLEKLRVVSADDPLHFMGESMAGALVVPCKASDGALSTLQLIPPPHVAAHLKAKGKPSKLNLPEHPVNGWFTVDTIVPGGVVYIVEGIGQAWACWQATGNAAVVCFGAGNMGKVAKALRQQDPTARLVMVPDVGKELDAAKIHQHNVQFVDTLAVPGTVALDASNNPRQATCGAHCRTTGEPCKNHQMPNGRCRMHDGKSAGRPIKSGFFTKEAMADRKRTAGLNREIRDLLGSG